MSDESDENVRERLGKRVREVWIEWAKTQPDPKPSWLVPWEEMEEKDREVDRQIGETIARESTQTKDEQIRLLSGSAKLVVETARRNAEEAATLSRDLERERQRRHAMPSPWAMLGLLIAEAALLVWTWSSIPEPVVCPPAPEPVICPAASQVESDASPPGDASLPTTRADSEGYWIEDGFGQQHRRPWPDASGYPAERFARDCHDVCEVRTIGSGEQGRVLSIDPTHLVCICLHPASVWPVTRWIGWERQ